MAAINNPHLLVIGGTGFIGRHLIYAAKTKDWKISSASLTIPTAKARLDKVDYYKVDFRNISSIKEQLNQRFDYVVNLGGYIDHTSFSNGGKKVIHEHFTSVQNLVEVLSRERLRKFIQIGSSHEYGLAPAPQYENLKESPISPYSFAKVASTHFLQMLYRTENFPFTVLRLFLTYGPGQAENRFLPQIIKGCLKNKKFPTSSGEQKRDFCFVEDTVRAIFAALTSEKANGEIFNVASGIPMTIRSVINQVSVIIGKGQPEFGKIHKNIVENTALYADIKKIKTILNWSPQVSLKEGLKITINSFK